MNGLTLCRLLSLAAAGALATSTTRGDVGAVGAMGDSLTDEYYEGLAGYAETWLEQLVSHRAISAGPTAPQDNQPGGTWGEPRRTGYEYNWARSGADSVTLLSEGQDTGLAAQVVPEGITHAVLAIGSNDFNPTGSAYFGIYYGFWSQSQIDDHVAATIANIETAVATMDATDADLVLVSVLDFGVVPAVWDSIFFGNPTNREKVADAIREVNYGLVDIARNHQLAMVDAFGFARTLFGPHADLNPTVTIGNVVIDLTASDTTNNANPLAGFIDDGAHPHTHLQGVIANVIIHALNVGYDAGILAFTEAEVLDHAGIAYGGSDTLEAQIGVPSDYVFNFAVPGDLDADGLAGVSDLLVLLGAWGPCPAPPTPCPIDLDGDGMVGVGDLLILLGNWDL